MPDYHVQLRIACPARPSTDDIAFLGPLKATVGRRGNEVSVGIHISADDLAGAFHRAQDLVLAGLQGVAEAAWVSDARFGAGRLFHRQFN